MVLYVPSRPRLCRQSYFLKQPFKSIFCNMIMQKKSSTRKQKAQNQKAVCIPASRNLSYHRDFRCKVWIQIILQEEGFLPALAFLSVLALSLSRVSSAKLVIHLLPSYYPCNAHQKFTGTSVLCNCSRATWRFYQSFIIPIRTI